MGAVWRMGASVAEATGACCRPTVDVAGNVPAEIVPVTENTVESGSSSVSDSSFYSSCDTADPDSAYVGGEEAEPRH